MRRTSFRHPRRGLAAAGVALCFTFGPVQLPLRANLEFVEVHHDAFGLEGPTDLALSPDGAFLYVAAEGDGAIAVLRVQEATGGLALVEAEQDGEAGVDGIAGVHGVAVSPDGRHLYAAGSGDNAVAVFSRDADSGRIAPLQVYRDGEGGIGGLRGPKAVVVTPDGRHVYSVSQSDSAVAAFARDSGTGALTFVEEQADGRNGVDGLRGAIAIAVSPDGRHLYVAGELESSVNVFSRDAETGALTPTGRVTHGIGNVTGLNQVRSVTVSPDGSHVYAVGSFSDSVAAFSRNAGSGNLTFIDSYEEGEEAFGINGPYDVIVTPGGGDVLVAGRGSNALAFFARTGDGSLAFRGRLPHDPGRVDGLNKAYAVATNIDGTLIFTASQTENAIGVIRFETATGEVELTDVETTTEGGSTGLNDPTDLLFGPGGEHLYIASRIDSAVSLFTRDSFSGTLVPTAVYRRGDGVAESITGPRSLALSPGGEQLYLGTSNRIAVFQREGSDGFLTYSSIVINNRDGLTALGGNAVVTVSPDGKHLYAAAESGNALLAFGRNGTTGALTFIAAWVDGGGASSLRQPRDLACSADGAHLYVAASGDSAITVFDRDSNSGLLTVEQVLTEAEVAGLRRVLALALSPGGNDLYAVGSSSLNHLSRDPGTGRLTAVSTLNEGLSGANALDVSADGGRVYVTAAFATINNDLIAYRRDPADGSLTRVDSVSDSERGSSGLRDVQAVAVSPGNRHVYTLGGDSDALAVFLEAAGPENSPPVLAGTSFMISAGAAAGTAVGTIQGSDPDAGDAVRYFITAGDPKRAFAINADSGVITVANPGRIDPGIGSYSLTVLATDGKNGSTTTVTVQVEPGSGGGPIVNWRAGFFDPADLADPNREATVWGDLADPNRDGLSNLEAYALGVNPTGPSDRHRLVIQLELAPAGGGGGELNHLFFTVKRRRNDPSLTFLFEVSPDLSPGSWTSGAGVVETVSSRDLDPEFEEVRVRVVQPITTADAQFIRLRIARQ